MHLQVASNHREEHSPKLLQLPLAHSADPRQRPLIARVIACHLAQSDIGENDMRRQAPLIGKLLAQPHQALKQQLITSDLDRKSTRLNSSHLVISYAVFCL